MQLQTSPTATVPAMIQTRSLSLFYGNKPAFRDVSLTIPKGEITALVGPSGCGKTSFLSCLNRLTDMIPNCRVSGDIWLEGENIMATKRRPVTHQKAKKSTEPAQSLNRRVGMIFQKPNPFPFSIWKNLALPLKEHGVTHRAELDAIIESTLQSVGLWHEVKDRLHTSALALSGGQQQRLCIARTLALKPEVILLDEPCSALDPLSSGTVEDYIASLKGTYTVVIVTHNLAQACRIADWTACFWVQNDSGCLIEHGPTEHIFSCPTHELTAAYVGGKKG